MAQMEQLSRSMSRKKTKQTQVLGMDVSDVSEHYLKPVIVRNASNDLYEQLIKTAAESIAQKIWGKADLDEQNPYVQASRALSVPLRRSVPGNFTSGGSKQPSHSRPLFGKLPHKGAKAGALKRARMQRLYDIIPEVPFESALKATCVPGAGTQALVSVLKTYIFSKTEGLPVAELQRVVQILSLESHTTQARGAAIFLRHYFYFSAMKCVYQSQELLRDVLDLMRADVLDGLGEESWDSSVTSWNWDELDKELFVKQFGELKVIQLYKQVRSQLKALKSQGSIALARIEREMLLKVIDDFLEQMDPNTSQVNAVQSLLMEVVEDKPSREANSPSPMAPQDHPFGRFATTGSGASVSPRPLPLGVAFPDGVPRMMPPPPRNGNMRPGTLRDRLHQLEAVLGWERVQHRQRLEREREVMRKLWAEEKRKLMTMQNPRQKVPDRKERGLVQSPEICPGERARLREQLEALQKQEREAVQSLQREKAQLEAKLATLTAHILPPPALKEMQENLESRHQQEMQALQNLLTRKMALEQELSRFSAPVGQIDGTVSLSVVVAEPYAALDRLEEKLQAMAERIKLLEEEKHMLELNLQGRIAVEGKLQQWQERVKDLESFLEQQEILTVEVQELKRQLRINSEERNTMEELIRAEQTKFLQMQEEKNRLEETLASLRQVEESLQKLGDSQIVELHQQLALKQSEHLQLQHAAAAAQQQITTLMNETQRLEDELKQKEDMEEDLKANARPGSSSAEQQLQKLSNEKLQMEMKMQLDANRIHLLEVEIAKLAENQQALDELRSNLQREQQKRLELEGIKADVERSLKVHASKSGDTGEAPPEWEQVKQNLLSNLEAKKLLEEKLLQQEQTMAKLSDEKTRLQFELDQARSVEPAAQDGADFDKKTTAASRAVSAKSVRMASREASMSSVNAGVDDTINMLVAEMSEVEVQLKSRIQSANRAGGTKGTEASEILLRRWQQEKDVVEQAKQELETRLQRELLERQLLEEEIKRMRESEVANKQLSSLKVQLQTQQQQLEVELAQSKQQVSDLEAEKKALAKQLAAYVEAQRHQQQKAQEQINALTADKEELAAAMASAIVSEGSAAAAQVARFELELKEVTKELNSRKAREQAYQEALEKERQQLMEERACWESEKNRMEQERERMLTEKLAYERDKAKLNEDMVKTMNMLKEVMSKTVLMPPIFKKTPPPSSGGFGPAATGTAELHTAAEGVAVEQALEESPTSNLIDSLQASVGKAENVVVTLPPSMANPEPEDPPSKEEIKEYAAYLGIDTEADADLLYIAEWALTAPLPENWTVHLDNDGNEFFFNTASTVSTYEHPMDQYYKEYYKEMRAAKLAGAVIQPPSQSISSKELIGKFASIGQ